MIRRLRVRIACLLYRIRSERYRKAKRISLMVKVHALDPHFPIQATASRQEKLLNDWYGARI